ncbi:MAG: hypothetical protein WB622_05515, partial [Acidobacteriaceae bacterium]
LNRFLPIRASCHRGTTFQTSGRARLWLRFSGQIRLPQAENLQVSVMFRREPLNLSQLRPK